MAQAPFATARRLARCGVEPMRVGQSTLLLVGIAARPCAVACLIALLLAAPADGQSSKVRITKLSDVAFGTVSNLGADSVRSQSICVYANTANGGYTITANGSESGGTFALGSGPDLLDYEVEWSPSPGQSSGTQLSPNVTLTGLVTSATQQTCNDGPFTSASLIIVLRSSALSSATAGSYSGTLTLIVGPE